MFGFSSPRQPPCSDPEAQDQPNIWPTYEINTDRRDVGLGVCVIGKTQQEARLSDTGIPNKQELEEVIVSEGGVNICDLGNSMAEEDGMEDIGKTLSTVSMPSFLLVQAGPVIVDRVMTYHSGFMVACNGGLELMQEAESNSTFAGVERVGPQQGEEGRWQR